jgi:hypothetical protein
VLAEGSHGLGPSTSEYDTNWLGSKGVNSTLHLTTVIVYRNVLGHFCGASSTSPLSSSSSWYSARIFRISSSFSSSLVDCP